MKYIIYSDMHGNFTATLEFESILKKLSFDKLFCLGDMIGKGPNSHKTFDWAMANSDAVIAGNWEMGILTNNYHCQSTAFLIDQLGNDRIKKISNLPLELSFKHNDLNVRLIHGRPIMPSLLHSDAKAQEFLELFNDGNGKRIYDLLVYGDIHRQLYRTLKDCAVINCGSIGNALGMPRLCFASLEVYEDGQYTCSLHSFKYDYNEEVNQALSCKQMCNADKYIKEVQTGVYSR